MLVHDIRKNETRVIDFRETAPAAIREDMFQGNLSLMVRYCPCCSCLTVYLSKPV